MAQKLSKKDIKNLDKVPYEKIRPFLKTGQIVFCSGSYLFFGAIQNWPTACGAMAIIYKDEELGRVVGAGSRALHWHSIDTLIKIPQRLQRQAQALQGADRHHRIFGRTGWKWSPQHHWLWPGWTYPAVRQLEIFRIMMRILFKVGKREKTETTSAVSW